MKQKNEIIEIPEKPGPPQNVLEILRQEKGTVSGEIISQKLGFTRAAVWKQVQALCGLGYDISAVQHMGYRLVAVANRPLAAEVAIGLRTKWLGRRWNYLTKVASTSNHLAGYANTGEAEGLVVVAEEQNFGRGRMARKWFSPPDVNLYMSALFRPNLQQQQVPSMYQVAALAVMRAVKKLYPQVQIGFKWPNDLMVDGKKLGGVLCDARFKADRVDCLIVGIGLNVNMRPSTLPPELKNAATSLYERLKREASRPLLAAEIINQLEELYGIWQAGGLRPLIPELEKASILQGRQATISTLNGNVVGMVQGFAPSGAIIVKTPMGVCREILSGDAKENNK